MCEKDNSKVHRVKKGKKVSKNSRSGTVCPRNAKSVTPIDSPRRFMYTPYIVNGVNVELIMMVRGGRKHNIHQSTAAKQQSSQARVTPK